MLSSFDYYISLVPTKVPRNVLPFQGIIVRVNFFFYQEGVRNVGREFFPDTLEYYRHQKLVRDC